MCLDADSAFGVNVRELISHHSMVSRRDAMSLAGYIQHVASIVGFIARCTRQLYRNIYREAWGKDTAPPTAERMYENGCTIFRGCTRMYEFLVVCGGGGQRFLCLLRDEAARLVLKLRAGARRAVRPSALGGRINGLAGLADHRPRPKGEGRRACKQMGCVGGCGGRAGAGAGAGRR
jgi:hypothetical protein